LKIFGYDQQKKNDGNCENEQRQKKSGRLKKKTPTSFRRSTEAWNKEGAIGSTGHSGQRRHSDLQQHGGERSDASRKRKKPRESRQMRKKKGTRNMVELEPQKAGGGFEVSRKPWSRLLCRETRHGDLCRTEEESRLTYDEVANGKNPQKKKRGSNHVKTHDDCE